MCISDSVHRWVEEHAAARGERRVVKVRKLCLFFEVRAVGARVHACVRILTVEYVTCGEEVVRFH